MNLRPLSKELNKQLAPEELEELTTYNTHVTKVHQIANRSNNYVTSETRQHIMKTLESSKKSGQDYKKKQRDLITLKENIRLYGSMAELNKKVSKKRIDSIKSEHVIKSLNNGAQKKCSDLIEKQNQKMMSRLASVKSSLSKKDIIKQTSYTLSHANHLSKFKTPPG